MRGGSDVRGCEMQLIVPRKSDNLDCTFCLDCVHACPAANVGILATLQPPSTALIAAKSSKNIVRRADLAVLLLLLIFAAFANAAGMIAPTVNVERSLEAALSISPFAAESLYLLLSLVVAPLLVLLLVGACSHLLSLREESLGTIICRFAPALVPLGAAMWLAHYGFHLVVGATSALPAIVRFAGDWGWHIPAAARIVRSCCATEPPGWLLNAEILCLDLGLLASLYAAYKTAIDGLPASRRRPPRILAVVRSNRGTFRAGTWIVFQPMEMRGTLPSSAAIVGVAP